MYRIGDCYSEKVDVTDFLVREIARISGDINPVHLNDEYAAQTIFGKRIAHGLFCLNHISKLIGNHLPGNGSILINQTFSYKKPVYIGDEIETTIKIVNIHEEKRIYTLETNCMNQDGEIILSGESKVKWMEMQ